MNERVAPAGAPAQTTDSLTAPRPAELAVGHVLGANVFNAIAVTGASALVGLLQVPTTLLAVALPVMVIATLLDFFMIMDQVAGLDVAPVLRLFRRHAVQPSVNAARRCQKGFASRPRRRLG